MPISYDFDKKKQQWQDLLVQGLDIFFGYCSLDKFGVAVVVVIAIE